MTKPRAAPHNGGCIETVIELRPYGRGNWEVVELRLRGRRAPPPMLFVPNEPVELGGRRFRVASVKSA